MTTSDTEDDNDVFNILDDDNDSYLAEISVSRLSDVGRKLSEVNPTWRRHSQGGRNTSLILRRSYNLKLKYSNTSTRQDEQIPEFRSNFHHLNTEMENAEYVALKERAATKIQECWRKYQFQLIFRRLRNLLINYSGYNSSAILRIVNPREADLMDRASGTFIRFRLSGETFPPIIVYKIFTNRPIVDLCKQHKNTFNFPDECSKNCSKNFCPRKIHATGENIYTEKVFVSGKGKLKNFDLQRYERTDKNDWRPFLGSVQVEKPRILNPPKPYKVVTNTSAIRKRRLKLELMKRLYENGRQKEREQ